ncbi:hypothetical protein J2S58_003733 [Nakamurella flavida]|nr:PPA1309 family protein [Nakamurella flavida]MDP9780110.1 hypothetical protein [Nakamurella flavida]
MSTEHPGRPEPVRPEPARPGAAGPGDEAPVAPPEWWEDTDLAVAVAEVEEFAAAGGWDAAPQMFALVSTADLIAAQPQLAGLDAASVFTPIAQESLPEGELADALAQILWPPEVVGCVLVQEILVLPPSAAESLSEDPERAAGEAAKHPEKAEARLTAGVLRGMAGGACLLRLRGDHEQDPLRGADLAPHLLTALRATFED